MTSNTFSLGFRAAAGTPPVVVKTAASVTGEMSELLALTRAVYELEHSFHWRCRGPNFLADHDLFAKIYAGTYADIDGIAEKIIGVFNTPEAVDPKTQSRRTAELVASMTGDGNDFPAQALAAEKKLMAQYDRLLGMKLSQGMQNFIQGLADAHETSCYLLKQRCA